MISKAVIAAGGLGTRIRAVTGDALPKALLPIAGEPVIFRQMQLLAEYKVEHVIVLAGHLADALRNSVETEAERLKLRLDVLVESQPLGTAGGLAAARALLGNEHYYFLCGDIAVHMDLDRLQAVHIGSLAAATVVVHPNDHPHDSDLIAVDEHDCITAIMPRGTRPPGYYRNLVFGSIYCLSPRVTAFVENEKKQDLNNDVLPHMLAVGERLRAYNTPEYLRDVGTAERLALVERDIASGFMESLHWSQKRPAVFFDRDGVLNVERGGRGVIHIDELEILPGAAAAVKTVNDSGQLAVVVTNQSAVAKGFITPKYLERILAKLETELGEHGARFDRIYHCPHHPEEGFPGEVPELKISCECRKPKPGMLLRAANELPIDLPNSCLIGDTQRDIVAAQRAGVVAYGVRTGRACRDCTGGVQPLLMFNDVFEAARFAVAGVPEAEYVVNDIVARIGASDRKQVNVSVCGPQASGKTMLAHATARALRRKGFVVNHISADDFRRFHGSDVIEIAQQDRYDDLLKSFELGEPTGLCADGRVANPASNVNIIEGLHACSPGLRSRIDYAVYVDAHDFVLEDRIALINRWMGKRADAIETVLSQVRCEEWRSVRQQLDFVDMTVRLSPLGAAIPT